MKNFIAYHLYYIWFHKKETFVSLVNFILFLVTLVSGIRSLMSGETARQPGYAVLLAAIGFLFNVCWSLYDDFLKDAIETRPDKTDVKDSKARMNTFIEACRKTENPPPDQWHLESIPNGHALFQPAINNMLIRTKALPAGRSKAAEKLVQQFIERHKDILFGFLYRKYKEAKGSNTMFFNERKLCMSSDLSGETDEDDVILLHCGCYYDTYLTNICSTKVLTRAGTEDEGEVIYDGQEHYPIVDGNIASLLQSRLNNEIGISTLAFTDDRHLVLWRQSVQSDSSKELLVPSGSGSADWADFHENDTLQQAVSRAMERELTEESTLSAAALKPIGQPRTRIIGYFRWLEKGAKPEFLGITKLSCKATAIKANGTEVNKRDIEHIRISQPDEKQLTNVLNGLLERKDLSLPLKMNLIFLRQYIAAEDQTDAEAREAAKQERLSFIFGQAAQTQKTE